MEDTVLKGEIMDVIIYNLESCCWCDLVSGRVHLMEVGLSH